MKYSILILAITSVSLISEAQSNNHFTISEISWSFTPPANFEFLDSSANNYKISETLNVWRKSLVFKGSIVRSNTIACSISTGKETEEQWNTIRPTETKRSYQIVSTSKPNLKFDSSTTSLTIDSIEFQKFSMIGKENGQIKYGHIQLTRLYKGYKIHFVYMFDDPAIGTEIEKQFLESKFTK